MNPVLTATLAGAAAAVFTAGATVVVQRLRGSGSVRTTEAETLWVEQGKIRQELYAQLELLRAANEKLLTDNVTLHTRVANMEAEIGECRKAMERYERRLRSLLSGKDDEE